MSRTTDKKRATFTVVRGVLDEFEPPKGYVAMVVLEGAPCLDAELRMSRNKDPVVVYVPKGTLVSEEAWEGE